MTSECNRFICFDLETTGLSVKTAEIIEISPIKMEDWEMSDCFNTFVKPSKPIPYEITELTGITNADVANAPEISEILPEFLKFINDEILLGHNISCYDLPILIGRQLIIEGMKKSIKKMERSAPEKNKSNER